MYIEVVLRVVYRFKKGKPLNMIPVWMGDKNSTLYPFPALQQVITQISDPRTAVHYQHLVGSGQIYLQAGGIAPKLHIFLVGTRC